VGGRGEVEVGGMRTPHTGSLCAQGRGLHYYGVGGQLQTAVREMGGLYESNTRRRAYCWRNYHLVIIMLEQMIIHLLVEGVTWSSFSTE